MSTNEIKSKIEALKEWEALIEEAKMEAENLRNEIKGEMLIRETDVMVVGRYVVRWTSVLTHRFDNAAFKKAMAIMADICKTITSILKVTVKGEYVVSVLNHILKQYISFIHSLAL